MSASNPTEDRQNELEVKLAFMEDALDKLNDAVTRQGDQIELLIREVMRLRQDAAAGESARAVSPREERPPHY